MRKTLYWVCQRTIGRLGCFFCYVFLGQNHSPLRRISSSESWSVECLTCGSVRTGKW